VSLRYIEYTNNAQWTDLLTEMRQGSINVRTGNVSVHNVRDLLNEIQQRRVHGIRASDRVQDLLNEMRQKHVHRIRVSDHVQDLLIEMR